jgi:hypothetical protein
MHPKLLAGLITTFVFSLNYPALAQNTSVLDPTMASVPDPTIPSVPELQKVEELRQEFNKSQARLNACSSLSIPEPINLLEPFPESWLKCVPNLSNINSNTNSM